MPEEIKRHWQSLNQWLKEQTSFTPSIPKEEIFLLPYLQASLETTRNQSSHRSVHFELMEPSDHKIAIDPVILKKIFADLLKNAIENTPDEGTIRIRTEKNDRNFILHIEDFGIGITEENQKSLFEGLFHTQETDCYTSKKPYDFYAGGKGLALLQAKLCGQRYGFDLLVQSRRCVYIPNNSDLCPGKISDCPYCQTVEDCHTSGGSIFSLSFPINPRKEKL
jgi:signal transduction histidine kinase